MRCVLHIGTEKTGTTLLQSWLYANQKQLGKQRVYLSDDIGKPNNRLFSSYFENGLTDWAKRNGISTFAEKERYFEGFLDRISEEVVRASKKHDVFVITSEHLHSRITKSNDIAAVAEFLKQNFAEVKVVCYFRDQFDMAVSHYSTALKHEVSEALEDYLERVRPQRYYFNFLKIADQWSEAFGKSNCVFRLYDRTVFPDRDIRKDFLCEALPEASLEKLDFTLGAANEALSSLQAVAYRAINREMPYWDKRSGGTSIGNTQLKATVSRIESLKKGTITSSVRDVISERFEESNREFFRKYLDESEGFCKSDEKQDEAVTFTIQDVEELVQDVFDNIVPGISHAHGLEDRHAVELRDIALKIEKGETMSIADALKLMELAQRARPEGPLIARKVGEYKDKLNLN